MIEGKNLEQAKRHPDVIKNQIKQNGGRETFVPYSPSNPPPYPVTSVNGHTGDVDIPTVDLPLPISEGGHAATTAAQAAKNLGVLPLGEVTTEIPSGADLNDYDLPGVYAIGGNSTAATIANIPQQSAGTLRVFASAGAAITASSTWKYLIQEYITYSGIRYQRYGGSGSGTAVTWDAWHQQILDFEIGNVIKTAAFTSDSLTIEVGRYGYIDIPVSLNGFTPIGIVGITGGGNGGASIIDFDLASSTSVRIYARNNISSAITIKYYRVTVLFIKSA